jgi:hypothetical protein
VGLVLAAVQLQNGKTGALGPYGATLLGRADAWLCSVLSVGSARALAVVSFPTPALACTTLSRWLERAELYYLTVGSTPFSLWMQSSQFGLASAASPYTRRTPPYPLPPFLFTHN